MNFYGEECPHCKKMNALLSRLEKEENISVERIEVWNSDKNLKRMKEYDKKLDFYQTLTGWVLKFLEIILKDKTTFLSKNTLRILPFPLIPI